MRRRLSRSSCSSRRFICTAPNGCVRCSCSMPRSKRHRFSVCSRDRWISPCCIAVLRCSRAVLPAARASFSKARSARSRSRAALPCGILQYTISCSAAATSPERTDGAKRQTHDCAPGCGRQVRGRSGASSSASPGIRDSCPALGEQHIAPAQHETEFVIWGVVRRCLTGGCGLLPACRIFVKQCDLLTVHAACAGCGLWIGMPLPPRRKS